MNENLIGFFRSRQDIFSLRRETELHQFLLEATEHPESLPVPVKLFYADEVEGDRYGFPVSKSPVLDGLQARLERWMNQEIVARTSDPATSERATDALREYVGHLVGAARNALDSSVLADYHSVFWLVHSAQLARLFAGFPERAVTRVGALSRDDADQMKYLLFAKWTNVVRAALPDISKDLARDPGFIGILLNNPLIATHDSVSIELRELRTYFNGYLRRDFDEARKWFQNLKSFAAELMNRDRLFRRAVALLGYPETPPSLFTLLDPRVRQLLSAHPSAETHPDHGLMESTAKRLLEFFILYYLRTGIVWMRANADGENVSEEYGKTTIYSRSLRPMDFGRRGVVEPIVYRFGLAYDITSFAQTLGEVARGGKNEEQTSYRQMVEFQRELADMTRKHALQFEKFLGDGALYTSRQAMRTIHAAIEIQRFYASWRAKGFAFDKGMRIALNYGYYRLLPIQVADDGTEIREFYGPGIVELSRLTTGKATREIEDIQQLLLAHGYDQTDVYRFFAPLSQTRDSGEFQQPQQREFYAFIDENRNLINEGIVASVSFLRQLSSELAEKKHRLYRLRAPWALYLGFPSAESRSYIGVRMLGAASLKGIGSMEVAEVSSIRYDEAEISLVDESRLFLDLLKLERNRSTARRLGTTSTADAISDLVVCESQLASGSGPVILVGEWDPASEEVRRPIRLFGEDAERYGLVTPLTAEGVELQSTAYKKLYGKLSKLETLPSFSVDALRHNANFSGFIIGESVERL
ncbi:MAG TPA: hypothetical protein VGS96_17620 [Thermoanaerobaculia bacterium]|nr:hypothetical protein [Thermoanaerobaculia bacterium]